MLLTLDNEEVEEAEGNLSFTACGFLSHSLMSVTHAKHHLHKQFLKPQRRARNSKCNDKICRIVK